MLPLELVILLHSFEIQCIFLFVCSSPTARRRRDSVVVGAESGL